MPRKKKTNVPIETQTRAEPKIPMEPLDQQITGTIIQGEFETIFWVLKKADLDLGHHPPH